MQVTWASYQNVDPTSVGLGRSQKYLCVLSFQAILMLLLSETTFGVANYCYMPNYPKPQWFKTTALVLYFAVLSVRNLCRWFFCYMVLTQVIQLGWARRFKMASLYSLYAKHLSRDDRKSGYIWNSVPLHGNLRTSSSGLSMRLAVTLLIWWLGAL